MFSKLVENQKYQEKMKSKLEENYINLEEKLIKNQDKMSINLEEI